MFENFFFIFQIVYSYIQKKVFIYKKFSNMN